MLALFVLEVLANMLALGSFYLLKILDWILANYLWQTMHKCLYKICNPDDFFSIIARGWLFSIIARGLRLKHYHQRRLPPQAWRTSRVQRVSILNHFEQVFCKVFCKVFCTILNKYFVKYFAPFYTSPIICQVCPASANGAQGRRPCWRNHLRQLWSEIIIT